MRPAGAKADANEYRFIMKAFIKIGDAILPISFHPDLAPQTCAAIQKILPFNSHVIHGRWSGEACWVPLGNLDLGVPLENQTHTPKPGQLLFYSKGISETEILVPYGISRFACKDGPLSGNHFASIQCSDDEIFRKCERVLLDGRKTFSIQLQ